MQYKNKLDKVFWIANISMILSLAILFLFKIKYPSIFFAPLLIVFFLAFFIALISKVLLILEEIKKIIKAKNYFEVSLILALLIGCIYMIFK